MTGAVRIRAARFSDFDDICDLNRKTLLEHRERNPVDFPEKDAGTSHISQMRSTFPKLWPHRRPSKTILVAEKAGRFAGYLWFAPHFEGRGRAAKLAVIWVNDVGVRDEFKGAGIATALVKACRELADRKGVEKLLAIVWAGNEASHALFQGQGFAPASTVYRLKLDPGKSDARSSVLNRPRDPLLLWQVLIVTAVFLVFGILAYSGR